MSCEMVRYLQYLKTTSRAAQNIHLLIFNFVLQACPGKDANELSEFTPLRVATYYKRPQLSSFDVTSRL